MSQPYPQDEQPPQQYQSVSNRSVTKQKSARKPGTTAGKTPGQSTVSESPLQNRPKTAKQIEKDQLKAQAE